jgi:uncharacterized membrane protein
MIFAKMAGCLLGPRAVESAASIIRMMIMEAVRTSETANFYQTQCAKAQKTAIFVLRRENLGFYRVFAVFILVHGATHNE